MSRRKTKNQSRNWSDQQTSFLEPGLRYGSYLESWIRLCDRIKYFRTGEQEFSENIPNCIS